MYTVKVLSFRKLNIYLSLLAVVEGCNYERILIVRDESTTSNVKQFEPNHATANRDYNQVYTLQCGLLRYYDTNIVPRNNEEVTNVDITFYLMSLLRFDEKEETLITSAWLSMSWQDQFLRLNDNPRYENVSEIFIKQKDIWKPDILLVNAVEHFKSLGSHDLVVTINDDVRVEWEPGQRFKTACSLNINMYPFDSQQCSLTFATWMHVNNIVSISSLSDEVQFDHFEENGEWDIVSTSAESEITKEDSYGVPTFRVTITLHRRRMYYVLTVRQPIIVLSILNCLVYLLPPASGEKISFCLTILLAYMVYISFLSDNLPRTSKTSSYLVVYLGLMICLSFLSVSNSVIVLLFWHRADDDEHCSDEKKGLEVNAITSGESNLNYVLYDYSSMSPNVANETQNLSTRKIQEHTKNKNIAKRLDRISFVIMSTLTLLITAVVLGLLLNS